MISILICSVNKQYLAQVSANITDTIGVEHEILFFENSVENKGIAEVYNILANKAKFSILLFLHEDVLFESVNWGQTLSRIYNDNPKIGVVGLAGCSYKSKYLTGWYTGIDGLDFINISHQLPNKREDFKIGYKGNEVEQVVCIDGVFMSCLKDVFDKNNFDETSLKGFHYYDIDFSIKANKFCNLVACYSINLVHITTGGNYGDNWVNETFKYHKRNGNLFPNTLLVSLNKHNEDIIIKTWLEFLKKYKISTFNKFKWIGTQRIYLKPKLFYSIFKFLFYKPIISKFYKLK